MKIFIDGDYKCHVSNDGTRREAETEFFDGKCRQFIEGYSYVPGGEMWTRGDGTVFIGEAINPRRDYSVLAELQRQYEEMLTEREDMKNALEAIYGGVTDE